MNKIAKIVVTVGLLIALLTFCSIVDGGAQSGAYPEKMQATVEVVVTLENGHTYVVEDYDKEVTVYTYGSKDPRNYEIKW